VTLFTPLGVTIANRETYLLFFIYEKRVFVEKVDWNLCFIGGFGRYGTGACARFPSTSRDYI
jgi:hypothetical protein